MHFNINQVRVRILMNDGVHKAQVSQRAQLWTGSAGSLAIRLAYVALGSLAAVVLARALGPKNYGIYVYAYVLISFLATPARFGLPALVERETAKFDANQQWARVRGLWRWANAVVIIMSAILMLGGGAAAWFLRDVFHEQTLITFLWGLVLIPLIALGSLRSAALLGLRKVVQGQLPEQIIRPLLLVVLIVAAAALGTKAVEPGDAMALHVLAATVAFVVGAWMLQHAKPRELTGCDTVAYEQRRWIAAVIPFAAMEGMFLLNNQIDIVLLGFFSNTTEVGIYRVASQGALFVGLGFGALGVALMPHYTRLHAMGDIRRFGILSSVGALGGFLMGVPVFLVFLVFGQRILEFVFGHGYVSAYLAMVILSGAQLLNVLFGMSGRLLNAAGFEKEAAFGVMVGAICNIVLNLILIPSFGIAGAAVATGISLVAWNIILWRMARRRLAVDSSLLSLFKGDTLAVLKKSVVGKA